MAIESHKIGIIGGGISGIMAAKYLSHYNPIVFEATHSIGGVWKHCSYKSTKLQTPHSNYEFTDFPWTHRDTLDFPSYREILDYLHSYATYFDVLKFVKFNSKVVELRFIGNAQTSGEYGTLLSGHPVWEVGVQTDPPENVQWYALELVVICTGKYGDVAAIPKFPENKGPENFHGKVVHTLDYCKLNEDESTQLLKGNKVVIIGFKKSALDLALECVQANRGVDGQACTMVVRTPHWSLPHYKIWGLPFYIFYSTRASHFLHQSPNQSFLRTLLHHILSPMRRAVSKIIECYLTWKLPLEKYGLKPQHPFEEDYASCQIPLLPQNFFSEVDNGNIVIKTPASKWWFWEGGIQFDDGTKLDADVVVLATGFDGKKKLQAIIPDPFLSLLEFPSGIMPLYRGTINPLIPNMAFVGYVESAVNLYTTEIRCKWLSRLVDQHFKLPSVEKMFEHTIRDMDTMRRATRFYKRSCISTFSINHCDEINEEMGCRPLRNKSLIAEFFGPYTQDFDGGKKHLRHS